MFASQKKVYILDSIMGSGKTTGIIQYMKDNPTQRYIYVSPMLTEVEERIPTEGAEINISTPLADTEMGYNKSETFLKMLTAGENISCTHKLFQHVTNQHLVQIRNKNYVLIIDEEFEMISPLSNSDSEKDIQQRMISGDLALREHGRIEWITDRPLLEGSSDHRVKQLCDTGQLIGSRQSDEGIPSFVLVQLPIELMTSAKKTIILSYMFKGSVMDCFLRLHGFDVVPFTDVVVQNRRPSEYAHLIELIETPSSKKISNNKRITLSSSGWNKMKQEDYDEISKLISNVRKLTKSTMDDLVYCVPSTAVKGRGKYIKVRGLPAIVEDGEYSEYAKGCWLHRNARATNKYANRSVMVHCLDLHPMQAVKAYLQDEECPVDVNNYALSTLLQWVWRSQIRNNKPIKLLVLSNRMRGLLSDWLKT